MEERPTVVVASASEGIRAQLRLTLGDERFAVIEAEDTRDAAMRVADQLPAVVVLDAGLPGDGAASLVKVIRQQPETAEIRILLLAPRGARSAGLPGGVDATVGMPATSFALLRRIEGLIEA